MMVQLSQFNSLVNQKKENRPFIEKIIIAFANAVNIEKIILNLDDKNNLDTKQDELIAKNAALIAQNSEILRKLQTKSSIKNLYDLHSIFGNFAN